MPFSSIFGIDRVHAINTDSGDNGVNFAILKISVPPLASAVLQTLSFYVDSGVVGNYRLALYSADGVGGLPSTLRAQTNSFAVQAGWNTAVPTSFPALSNSTDYWIALQLDNAATTIKFNGAPANSAVFYAMGYGAFDATFNAAPSGVPRQYLCYATCLTTPYFVGNTGTLGEVETGALGFNLGAKKIAVLSPCKLTTISVNVKTALGNLRVGIYDATGTGGIANNLIAQATSAAMTTGWNNIPILTQPTLSPASYWLALQTDSNTAEFWCARNQVVGDYIFYAFAYAAFPSLFNPAPTTSNLYVDMYMTGDSLAAGGASGYGGGTAARQTGGRYWFERFPWGRGRN